MGVEFPDTRGGGAAGHIVRLERTPGDDWLRGAPDLVIEILSPSTAARDRELKRKLYRRRGVAEYWIVDPERATVEVWNFGADATAPLVASDRLTVRVRGAVVGGIDLSRIFPKT